MSLAFEVALILEVVLCVAFAVAWASTARKADELAEQIRLVRGQLDFANSVLGGLSDRLDARIASAAEPTASAPTEEPEILQHTNVSAVSRSAKVREWMAQLEFAAAQEREKVNAE